MELLQGIRADGLTLYLEKHKTIVFADTHLGYEEYLNKEGILVPKFQYKSIVNHLEETLSRVDIKKIVINGDLKHEFGTISQQEWKEVLEFLDFLEDYDVVLVKGNHDNTIGPIANKKNVSISEFYNIKGIYILHGHKIPKDKQFRDAKVVVIAHEHPTVGLREEGRVEKVKCFLVGKWKNKDLIVLPSLNFVTEGSDILQEKTISPFLDDIGNFKVYCYDKKLMYFGRVRDLLTRFL